MLPIVDYQQSVGLLERLEEPLDRVPGGPIISSVMQFHFMKADSRLTKPERRLAKAERGQHREWNVGRIGNRAQLDHRDTVDGVTPPGGRGLAGQPGLPRPA